MPNPKRGGIRQKNGKYYARVSYKAADGKRYYIERLAENKSHARQLVRTLLTEIEIQAGAAGSKMTLAELANFYRVRYIAPPQYQNNQKVDGLRGHGQPQFWTPIRSVVDFFAGLQVFQDVRFPKPDQAAELIKPQFALLPGTPQAHL